MKRILRALLALYVFSAVISAQVSQADAAKEQRGIAALARITLEDHSSILFLGLTASGYIRDGKVFDLTTDHGPRRSDFSYCLGQALSSDGLRIAYATAADDLSHCVIIVRDLESNAERTFARIDSRARVLAWSWNDNEIAYTDTLNVIGVVTTDGMKRVLGRLPLRIDGKVPMGGWVLRQISWLHHRPELVLDADVSIPTRESGTYSSQSKILMLSLDDSRELTPGCCSAVSPVGDQIAYIDDDHVWVIDADGSNRHLVTSIPRMSFFLPFMKESPWLSTVWSPTGNRLFFSTILDEGGNTNLYLVDVKSGHRRRILKHTSLLITAWRSSSPIPNGK